MKFYIGIERFDKFIEPLGDCWIWTGSLRGGYGRFSVNSKLQSAHRFSYSQIFDDLKDELTLDHLCYNTPCVNPWHLEQVTREINCKRSPNYASNKTHCKNGHELNEDNVIIRNRITHKERVCRVCRNERVYKHWRLKGRVNYGNRIKREVHHEGVYRYR